MSWGPIDADWGEGWDDFDHDPFAPSPSDTPIDTRSRAGDGRRSSASNVTRLPRRRVGRRGDDLERSLTAPRPTTPTPRRPTRPLASSSRRSDPVGARPEPGGRRRGTPTQPRSERRSDAHLRAAPEPAARRSTSRSTSDRAAAPRPSRSGAGQGGSGQGGSGRGGGSDRVATAEAKQRRRRLAVVVGLVALLLVVVAKLVWVQVADQEHFATLGEDQRLRVVPLPADRGRILDRDGHDLALSVLSPSVYADPGLIDDVDETAEQLAGVLDLSPSELVELLSRDSRFVYLDRHVSDDVAAGIVELDLDAVKLLEEPERITPAGDLARSIVGTVADDHTGSTGIEALFDETLTGEPGENRYERAAGGGTIAAAGQSRIAPRAGDDIVLTIDRSLQYEAERVLSEQVDALDAKGGIVIIAEPSSGDVLALANITRAGSGDLITAGANRAVIDVFEPGSVNKMITIAAALEEGLVEPDSERVVPWRYQVADHRFSDDHAHGTAPMTVTDILAKSSNVGTIMLGQELGKDRIDAYLRDFGFGSRTALGFENESPGILLPTDRWSGTSIGSIPIGQGIAVTAMQMLSAYNVIANDGLYVEPRLVSATVDADGDRNEIEPTGSRRVVSADTAREVRDMLAEAVENGTGKRAQVPGYSVGGKTGTARKPQDNGTYQDAAGNYHYVAVFNGMVPAENPELSVIVVIDEPKGNYYGGTAAAPVFADLARFALNRFQIPPAAAPTAARGGSVGSTPTDLAAG